MTPRVPGGTFTNYGKQLVAEKTGAMVHDDVYGLRVYENPETAVFLIMGEIGMSVGEPLEGTLESWRDALSSAQDANERVLVSYDLYAHSRFESSSRARFLLLVMAIEALLQQGDRPSTEIIALDNAIAAVRQSDLPDERKNGLAAAIGQLKRESIGTAAKTYLARAKAAGVLSNEDPERLFRSSYRVRNAMVHEGITPIPPELSNWSNHLESMVKELLVANFEGRWA